MGVRERLTPHGSVLDVEISLSVKVSGLTSKKFGRTARVKVCFRARDAQSPLTGSAKPHCGECIQKFRVSVNKECSMRCSKALEIPKMDATSAKITAGLPVDRGTLDAECLSRGMFVRLKLKTWSTQPLKMRPFKVTTKVPLFCVHTPAASNALEPVKDNTASDVAVLLMPESVNLGTQSVNTGPVVLKVTVTVVRAQGFALSDPIDEEELKATARICSGWASPLDLPHAVRAFQAVSSRDDASAGSPMEATEWVVGSCNTSSRTIAKDMWGLGCATALFVRSKRMTTLMPVGMVCV